MKLLDLRMGFYGMFNSIDIRPSLKERIKKDFTDSFLYDYKSLCLTTEEKLLSLPHVTPDAVRNIQYFLSQYGLILGMTEKELDDYMDAEYFDAHPEESEISHEESESYNPTINFMGDKDENSTLEDNGHEEFFKEKQAASGKPTSSIDPQESIDRPFDEEKEAVKALRQTYQDPLEWVRYDDWVWYGHQARLFLLTSQPWYVKCFMPFKKRLERASKQADELISKYRTDMATRSLFFRKLKAYGQYERWMSGEELF